MSKNDISLTYDDIDVIASSLEFAIENIESVLASGDLSAGDEKETRRNLRRLKAVLKKVESL